MVARKSFRGSRAHKPHVKKSVIVKSTYTREGVKYTQTNRAAVTKVGYQVPVFIAGILGIGYFFMRR